ncbi:hypothetical protein BJ912DRAFT_922102 [Pholiota molesta]|nr:hypothetical protein BJ912DRAFT_922102 [Pholiota molesta]
MLRAIGLREPMALGYIFLDIWSFMSHAVFPFGTELQTKHCWWRSKELLKNGPWVYLFGYLVAHESGRLSLRHRITNQALLVAKMSLAQRIVYGSGCSSAGAILVLSLPFVIAFLDAGSTPIQCFIVILAFRAVVSNGTADTFTRITKSTRHRLAMSWVELLFGLLRLDGIWAMGTQAAEKGPCFQGDHKDGFILKHDQWNWMVHSFWMTRKSQELVDLKEMSLERGSLPEIEEKCQTTRLGMFLAITFKKWDTCTPENERLWKIEDATREFCHSLENDSRTSTDRALEIKGFAPYDVRFLTHREVEERYMQMYRKKSENVVSRLELAARICVD